MADREDPGIRQIRELTRLIKAGVPPGAALSLVKLWGLLLRSEVACRCCIDNECECEGRQLCRS
jgi:hypothetical protein